MLGQAEALDIREGAVTMLLTELLLSFSEGLDLSAYSGKHRSVR